VTCQPREAQRETIRPLLAPGTWVDSPLYGTGTIARVNQKTAKVKFDRGFTHNDPIEWLTVIQPQRQRQRGTHLMRYLNTVNYLFLCLRGGIPAA
jgi:hypothetical protein